jgi:hypothetical protein
MVLNARGKPSGRGHYARFGENCNFAPNREN